MFELQAPEEGVDPEHSLSSPKILFSFKISDQSISANLGIHYSKHMHEIVNSIPFV